MSCRSVVEDLAVAVRADGSQSHPAHAEEPAVLPAVLQGRQRDQAGRRCPVTTDRLIKWSTVLAVAAVALVAGWVSYVHAYDVVTAHGEHGALAHLYPGTIDGLIYAASMVLLDATRRDVKAPKLAYWLLAVASPSRSWPTSSPGWRSASSARLSQRGPRWRWSAATSFDDHDSARPCTVPEDRGRRAPGRTHPRARRRHPDSDTGCARGRAHPSRARCSGSSGAACPTSAGLCTHQQG